MCMNRCVWYMSMCLCMCVMCACGCRQSQLGHVSLCALPHQGSPSHVCMNSSLQPWGVLLGSVAVL